MSWERGLEAGDVEEIAQHERAVGAAMNLGERSAERFATRAIHRW